MTRAKDDKKKKCISNLKLEMETNLVDKRKTYKQTETQMKIVQKWTCCIILQILLCISCKGRMKLKYQAGEKVILIREGNKSKKMSNVCIDQQQCRKFHKNNFFFSFKTFQNDIFTYNNNYKINLLAICYKKYFITYDFCLAFLIVA